MKTKKDEVVKRLRELNDIIKSLDPSIRQQSFDILSPLFLGTKNIEDENEQSTDHVEKTKNPQKMQSKENFFKSFDHKKPSDNVFLIVAWLFSQHGVIVLSSDLIRKVADDTGLTVPGRPDMTLKSAQKQGKHLFTKQGSGYKPTVHGEAFLKETYSVKKGTIPLKLETES